MGNNYIKKIFFLSIGTILIFLGLAIHAKLDIGVGAFDAFSITLTYITNISLGAILFSFNILFLLVQILVERKKFKLKELLQVSFIICSGFLIDFFIKNVLSNFYIEKYFFILLMFLLALLLKVTGIILILEVGLFKLPLEGMCLVISDRVKLSLGTIRIIMDAICIILSIVLTLILSLNWTIREGTVIVILLEGPLLDLFRKPVARFFKKLKIT